MKNKCGSYDGWFEGQTRYLVFKLYGTSSDRPAFILMGNIATSPFVAFYSMTGLTSNLQKINPNNIVGNASQITVNVNANLGDFSQLRMQIVAPAGVGTRIQVIVPSSELIGVS